MNQGKDIVARLIFFGIAGNRRANTHVLISHFVTQTTWTQNVALTQDCYHYCIATN